MEISKRSYWSVADCCWVEAPATPAVPVDVAVPQQREDELAERPVDA